jgi:hypothetical protein
VFLIWGVGDAIAPHAPEDDEGPSGSLSPQEKVRQLFFEHQRRTRDVDGHAGGFVEGRQFATGCTEVAEDMRDRLKKGIPLSFVFDIVPRSAGFEELRCLEDAARAAPQGVQLEHLDDEEAFARSYGMSRHLRFEPHKPREALVRSWWSSLYNIS